MNILRAVVVLLFVLLPVSALCGDAGVCSKQCVLAEHKGEQKKPTDTHSGEHNPTDSEESEEDRDAEDEANTIAGVIELSHSLCNISSLLIDAHTWAIRQHIADRNHRPPRFQPTQ